LRLSKYERGKSKATKHKRHVVARKLEWYVEREEGNAARRTCHIEPKPEERRFGKLNEEGFWRKSLKPRADWQTGCRGGAG